MWDKRILETMTERNPHIQEDEACVLQEPRPKLIRIRREKPGGGELKIGDAIRPEISLVSM